MFIIEIVMPKAAAQMHPIMVLFKYVFCGDGMGGVRKSLSTYNVAETKKM